VKVAIAQLALVAISPRPYCAVGLERQAVVVATSNRRDSSQSAHLNWRSHAVGGIGVKIAIAQLALDAVAPSPHCAVGLNRQAVPRAASNRRDSSQSAYSNRRSHPLVSGGVKVAIAQLAKGAQAPSPYCAVGLERQAVAPPAGNRRDSIQ